MTFLVSKSADGKGVTMTVQAAPVIASPELAADAAAKAEIEVHASVGEHIALPRTGGVPADVATFNLKTREPKIEKLGKQMIEGVEAEGQRATITIPAGEIGNEQPILIVSESWYSPDLQVTVMTRHSDPRMGETVYKLTNINRAEPPASLFQVPSDYTVKEAVEPGMKKTSSPAYGTKQMGRRFRAKASPHFCSLAYERRCAQRPRRYSSGDICFGRG
jgi:hypothetical protein